MARRIHRNKIFDALLAFERVNDGDAASLGGENLVVCIHCLDVRVIGDRPISAINAVLAVVNGVFFA